MSHMFLMTLTFKLQYIIFTFGCCILLRIYPTGSLWCRQSQQSFNTSIPPFLFFLLTHLHYNTLYYILYCIIYNIYYTVLNLHTWSSSYMSQKTPRLKNASLLGRALMFEVRWIISEFVCRGLEILVNFIGYSTLTCRQLSLSRHNKRKKYVRKEYSKRKKEARNTLPSFRIQGISTDNFTC
jgi:hypothetical protein